MGKIEAGRTDILNKWASDMEKLDKHHDAMLKQEENRYASIKSGKRNTITRSKIQKQEVISPVKQYIEQDSVEVNASQLGASMSPVTSKVLGLGKLRSS